MIASKTTMLFGDFKFLLIFFPSTIIKLEIAFTSVSIVLTVNDIAKIIIVIDNNSDFSSNTIEKKARSVSYTHLTLPTNREV